ncbi:uncharacterized protein LOC141894975 [Acropora palmata]|uniref:uncharacterized protein LOC141894975 n=1 Tax=Acropora palmata TaxID=6131 RepID=UPI003DA1B73B
MVFLLHDMTSRGQPLSAGIIKNFKVNYRNLLLKFVVSHVNSQSTAAEIVSMVDVKPAWEEVPRKMIRKCFQKRGFSPAIFPTSAPAVNTSTDNWWEALRDEALSLCANEAEEPASKETVVEDSDQEEVDIEPVESSIACQLQKP